MKLIDEVVYDVQNAKQIIDLLDGVYEYKGMKRVLTGQRDMPYAFTMVFRNKDGAQLLVYPNSTVTMMEDDQGREIVTVGQGTTEREELDE